MALVKLDHVLKLMRERELPYWRLTDNSGLRNMVAENDTEESVETGIEELEEALSNIEDNIICVMISNRTKKQKSGGGRGYIQMEMKINLHKAETGFGAGNNGMLAMLLAQMEKNSNLVMQLMEQKKESELAELRREIKEMKNDGSGKFEKYQPYLDKLFGVQKESHGIASVGEEDTEVDEKVVKAQARIRSAIKRLVKIDSNLPDTITLIANFAEKHPDKYKAFAAGLPAMI